MAPIIPVVIVFIYLIASVISAVMQALKNQGRTPPPRIPKAPPAPPQPQTGRGPEMRRPEPARQQAQPLKPAATTAPAEPARAAPQQAQGPTLRPVLKSGKMQPRVRGASEADFGFGGLTNGEAEDLAVDAEWDDMSPVTPQVRSGAAAAAKPAAAGPIAADLAAQLWAGVVFSEILREPRAFRPWPAR